MTYEEYIDTLKPAQRKVAGRAFAYGEGSGLATASDSVQRACQLHKGRLSLGCILCGWAVDVISGKESTS